MTYEPYDKNRQYVFTPEEFAAEHGLEYRSDDTAASPAENGYVPFPVDCLPKAVRDYVEDTCRSLDLKETSSVAAAALAVIGGVIGASCRIVIKRGYIETPALFVAIVNASGTGKSPAIRSCKGFLQGKQNETFLLYKQTKDEFETEYRRWKNTPKDKRDNEPEEPKPAKRYIIGDITIEAVARRLEENPLGLVLIRDELAAFFGGFDAYRKSDTDLQKWIEIFNSEPLKVDRVSDAVAVENPSISVLGGIQTGILEKQLKERPDFLISGFGARFLFVKPPKSIIYWNDNEPDETITAGWENIIETILRERENTVNDDGRVKPLYFGITKEGYEIIKKYQRKTADYTRYETQAAVEALLRKAGMIAARLALILHVTGLIERFGRMTDESGNLPPISSETITSACRLSQWFLDEGERLYTCLYGEVDAGELSLEQKDVMKVLQRERVPMTKDQIKRHSRPCRDIDKGGRLDGVLSELVKLKKIEERIREHQNSGGRPTFEYRILSTESVA
jgi:hypothetical protein